MSTIEIIGFVTGVVGVWLTTRENIWCFPVGITNVIISFFLFTGHRLYSDAIQQVFYLLLLTYGWTNWHKVRTKTSFKPTWLSKTEWTRVLLIIAMIGSGMGFLFSQYTDADVPYIDAFATAMSFVAQFLIAGKKTDNWIIWIVVNITYISVYIYKDLYLYAGLFTIYLVLAIKGLIDWNRKSKAFENV